jgi:hypothetical protein
MFNYFDDWETHIFNCRECGWIGTGKEAASGMNDNFMDLVCPRNELHPPLAIIMFPTLEEMLAHRDIPWVRAQLERAGCLPKTS